MLAETSFLYASGKQQEISTVPREDQLLAFKCMVHLVAKAKPQRTGRVHWRVSKMMELGNMCSPWQGGEEEDEDDDEEETVKLQRNRKKPRREEE